MNKYIAGLVLIVCICPLVRAEDPIEIQRVRSLSKTLESGGVYGLCSYIQEHQAPAPYMPSQWRVEHRPGSVEQQMIDLASREFGQQLAVQLATIAPEVQCLPPGDELCRRANMLCDLSDWCASTPGYGNLFLAQRCLDLAAVGMARLTAS